MVHIDYRKKSTHAYAQLFGTIAQLGLPCEDMEEAYRRMVFNLMGRNCDDHSKNFSFLLREGQTRWALAPACDISFAHTSQGEWTHQHLMSVNGKYKDFDPQDLLAEANRFGIGSAQRVIHEVRSALSAWRDFARQAGLPEEETRRTEGQFVLLR